MGRRTACNGRRCVCFFGECKCPLSNSRLPSLIISPQDARALEEPKNLIVNVIPELEREYEELMRELEKERAEVTEIEAGDQDYLNELKATIAEQKWVLFELGLYSLLTSYSIEIEALKAELSEGTDQVRWLQERMDEIEVQKREAKNTINTAERVLHMKQTSTRSEVFRLKGIYNLSIYLCIIQLTFS